MNVSHVKMLSMLSGYIKTYLVNLEMALLATVTESEANLFEVQGRKKCLFLFLFSFLLLAANFRFKAMNGLLGNLPTVK